MDDKVKEDEDYNDDRDVPAHAGYVHGAAPFQNPFKDSFKPSRPAPPVPAEPEDEFEDVDFQTSVPSAEGQDYGSGDGGDVYQPSTADQGSNFEEELKAYLPTFVNTDPLFRRKFPSRRGKIV